MLIAFECQVDFDQMSSLEAVEQSDQGIPAFSKG